MTEYLQVPTLYAFAIVGMACGVTALILSILTYKNTRQSKRVTKSLVQGMELLLAGQDKATAEFASTKDMVVKTLRELEHDHDKFKDTLEGYSQTLDRIEIVARKVKENQNQYLIKNNSHTGSSNNKIKVNTPKPDLYEGQLLNALLAQLIDKMQK